MIAFANAGEIDIRSISTFGVSVKEGGNPIGFFGTGLKYAIAVLLRTGHQVTIHAGASVVRFDVSAEHVRGQEFDFVTMQVDGGAPAPIGFTTELGKCWELWMAYREIACNCIDEGGAIQFCARAPAPAAGTTSIIVQGEAFEAVFARRHEFILEDQPAFMVGNFEVRNRASRSYYYRTVKVMELDRGAMFTYNDTSKLDLTEDRTVKFQWEPKQRLTAAILRSDNTKFIRSVVLAPDDTFEGQLDFHGWGVDPSAQFLEVCGMAALDKFSMMNQSAFKVWKDATKMQLAPTEIETTMVQRKSMEKALDFCGSIGFPIRGSYPIKVVESLGDGTLGLAHDETIFIAERVFHLGGTKQLAATLIEEYLHLRHGWKDMSRELQSFLFEKLVSVGEELVGEPL